VQVALATQNSALAAIVEKMWTQRVHNPYWKKLHDHIDLRTVDNWCDDHDQILKALIRKDPHAAKVAMWQHLENTNRCCLTKPAMTSNSMLTAICLRKTRCSP
jgi:GntR family hexuronate regulon transcriptional repressor